MNFEAGVRLLILSTRSLHFGWRSANSTENRPKSDIIAPLRSEEVYDFTQQSTILMDRCFCSQSRCSTRLSYAPTRCEPRSYGVFDVPVKRSQPPQREQSGNQSKRVPNMYRSRVEYAYTPQDTQPLLPAVPFCIYSLEKGNEDGE